MMAVPSIHPSWGSSTRPTTSEMMEAKMSTTMMGSRSASTKSSSQVAMGGDGNTLAPNLRAGVALVG